MEESKTAAMVVVVLIIGIFIGSGLTVVLLGSKAPQTGAVIAGDKQAVPQYQAVQNQEQPTINIQTIEPDDIVLGKTDAPITVIEYADPSCPFCGAVAGENQEVINYLKNRDPKWEAPIPSIIRDYVNTGKAKLVFRYFIGHGTGEDAMKIMLCANDQGKFWELHDLVFANQGDVEDIDKIKSLAKSIGVDVSKVDACLSSNKYDAKIQKDIATGRAAGVSGTPDFFINGIEVNGAQSFSAIKKVIDSVLK